MRLSTQRVKPWSAIVEKHPQLGVVSLQGVVAGGIPRLQQEIFHRQEMVEVVNDAEAVEEAGFAEAFFREMARTHVCCRVLSVHTIVCNLTTPLHQFRRTVS